MPKTVNEKAYVAELRKLMTQPPVQLELSALEAWVVMANLQLACRHPHNSGPTRAVAETVARRIEDLIAHTPELRQMAQMGWNPAYDVEEKP